MKAACVNPGVNHVNFTICQQYLTLTGAWITWLFVTLDSLSGLASGR
jgi:hypothetical protein